MQEEELKELRRKLESAINESLTESSKINITIQDIREAGYEVFLIIEATIGFNRKEAAQSEGLVRSKAVAKGVRLQLTSQDAKFLKSLKISPE
ncbi:MAG: hypothetical protein HYX74_04615 [Acidobacteria bacterium]|nr:hypothetical protein [Acidobacteriota bacterium]